MPSSAWWTCRARLTCRRAASRASACRSTRRQPRTIRSTCAAVPARPTASSRASVSGVATRVRARTLAYDSPPRAKASPSRGSVARARATLTRSRAAPTSRPTRQASHPAQERKPVFHPPRASNSRIRVSRRAVAASRCADSSAISSPSRSSSATAGCVGTSAAGESIGMASPPSAGATLHHGFRALWERARQTISERGMIFSLRSPDRARVAPRRPLGRHLPRACGPGQVHVSETVKWKTSRRTAGR
jgi:hypothetical protein